MNNRHNHVYFDGTDPRFPDLSATVWLSAMAESAARLARDYRFTCLGVEHILHELLSEPGFRSLIEASAGDPDLCRGQLARSFRQHAQFCSMPVEFGMTQTLATLLREYDIFLSGPEGASADAALADLYTRVLRGCDSSAIAEMALQDSGAGGLLVEFDDFTFMDDAMGYAQDIPEDERLPYPEGHVSFSDRMDLMESPDGELVQFDDMPQSADAAANPPLVSLLDKMGGKLRQDHPTPAEKEQIKRNTPTPPEPAKKTPADKMGMGDVAADIEACLRNIGEQAATGDIDPVLGRDKEIDLVLSILRRRRKSSVILTGEAGVGKTAIAEGIALRLRDGAVEEALAKRPIYELSLTNLVAGTKFRGDFEARMRLLINKFRDEKAIVFIDEVHMIVGSGSTYGRGMDGANMLKTALGRGEITIIGATTQQELRELRRDAAMMRRFDVVNIDEPDAARTLEILQGAAWPYMQYHQVGMATGVLEEICRVTDLYQPDRRFPDKAFDLLDAACVVCVEESPDIKYDLPDLEIDHVLKGADRLGLRRPKLPDAGMAARVGRLAQTISGEIGAQHEAAERLADEATAAILNLSSSGVRANYLLAAPTGADADQLASRFAAGLGLPFCRVDLSQLRDPSQLWQLIGLASSVGPDRTGRLVEAADGYTDMVLWFTGMDMAAQSIREFIAETALTGMFRAADGRSVSLRGAWFLTGISYDPDKEGTRIGFSSGGVADQDLALERRLGADLIRGYDAVIHMEKPGAGAARAIASRVYSDFMGAVAELGCALTAEPAVIEYLAGAGTDKEIRVLFRDTVRNVVLRSVMSGKTFIHLTISDGKISI